MSYPTTPAFVHVGTWDDQTRSHPAIKWLESYTADIDAKKWDKPATQDHTDDCSVTKSDGRVVNGADAAWKSLATEVYGPFAAHVHDPQFLVVWEEDGGYTMIGLATVFGNLLAPGPEPKVSGVGKEWDVAIPSAFKFHFVGSGESLKLSRSQIFSNPAAAMVKMLKRGMISAEQLTQG